MADDALQRRIARFVAEAPERKAINRYVSLTAATDIGQTRKSNQDRSIVITASYSYAPERNFNLAVVCDGVGGLARGDEAATLALSTFASAVIRTTSIPATDRLVRGATAANDAVANKFSQGSGTTLSSVLITKDLFAHCVNVGDSRVYGITENRKIVQLTVDDTLKAHQRNINQENNALSNHLLQYIGMGDELIANIYSFYNDDYESILLTTDGIHSAPDVVLDAVVKRASTNRDMVDRFFSVSESLGGRDNATLVLIENPFQPRPSSEQGLTLTLLSPSDRLEIWIPRPSHENREESLPEALAEAGITTNHPSDHRSGDYSNKKKNKSRRKSRQPSAQDRMRFHEQHHQENTTSNDEQKPALDITFPEDSKD
ncbi:PP2C family protein-serine/threonine phosphatase [Methylobacterium platani]|uniref:PP2C family protein-serine/threonine phosphatase n=1 Tax=Methylobacterium platani TaxID=427683 RepID=UPI001428A03A|nr:PP2C family serine/threonine-protein phosphatase [Methylobacterium platani]